MVPDRELVREISLWGKAHPNQRLFRAQAFKTRTSLLLLKNKTGNPNLGQLTELSGVVSPRSSGCVWPFVPFYHGKNVTRQESSLSRLTCVVSTKKKKSFFLTFFLIGQQNIDA
jgi:hypothetical protein